MKEYRIYTDGSCRANGNGGLGIVWLKDGKKVFEFSKSFKNTTNNQMELMAIYIGIKVIVKPLDSLEIISDSEYALGSIFNDNWNPKKNKELIAKIKKQLEVTQKLIKNPIKYRHVYGHQKEGNEDMIWNNYVDKLASESSINIL